MVIQTMTLTIGFLQTATNGKHQVRGVPAVPLSVPDLIRKFGGDM